MAGKFSYQVGNHSDKGMVRKNNQDSFGSATNAWGEIYIVADGMGGHKGGEVASQITVSHITNAFKKADANEKPIDFLERTIQEANQLVLEKGKKDNELEGMGTTIVCILMVDDIAHIAHVGDSRLYIFRYNNPYFVTKDHSVVQDLLDKGLISEQEAEDHPNKNRILQAIGIGKISTSITIEKLYKGDYVLLCSDGLTGEVSVPDIFSIIKSNKPMDATEKLIDKANNNGGSDNTTAIVLKVDKGPNPPKQKVLSASHRPTTDKKNVSSYMVLSFIIGSIITLLAIITYSKVSDLLIKDEPIIDIDPVIIEEEQADQSEEVEEPKEEEKADQTEESAPSKEEKVGDIGNKSSNPIVNTNQDTSKNDTVKKISKDQTSKKKK
ncbi:MAG: hypothetical protein CMI31_13095 [Opitutae bacterium]|nr:hypothetical protein [Opitutae bacterium]